MEEGRINKFSAAHVCFFFGGASTTAQPIHTCHELRSLPPSQNHLFRRISWSVMSIIVRWTIPYFVSGVIILIVKMLKNCVLRGGDNLTREDDQGPTEGPSTAKLRGPT